MYVFLSILILAVCVILILIVLVQNSKGGGLASSFSSSNQFMGVRKTADFLEKATWTLAGSLLFLCLLASVTIPRGESAKKSAIEEQVRNANDPSATPNFPTTAPAAGSNTKNTAPAPATSKPTGTTTDTKKDKK
jgi:preprotein translocase subunit SecG